VDEDLISNQGDYLAGLLVQRPDLALAHLRAHERLGGGVAGLDPDVARADVVATLLGVGGVAG
jgi:hypothetical protein